jgi:hypothetical protein
MASDAGDPVGGAQHSRNLAKESSVESPRDLIDRARLIQRYDLVTNYRCGSSIEEMERSDDGEWMRWEDVAALLACPQEDRPQENQSRGAEQTVIPPERATAMETPGMGRE